MVLDVRKRRIYKSIQRLPVSPGSIVKTLFATSA